MVHRTTAVGVFVIVVPDATIRRPMVGGQERPENDTNIMVVGLTRRYAIFYIWFITVITVNK